jgi:hypothetical protein
VAKRYVLKDDVSITFTPDEIWNLVFICEGAKVLNQSYMRDYPKGSKGYTEYKNLADIAEQMQKKITTARNVNSVLEEVE